MSFMVGELDGRVAIVTGSGDPGGIGAMTARVLGQSGARVVVADVNVTGAQDVAEILRGEGLDVTPCGVDISDEERVKALMAFTVETYGRLDILDNNARGRTHFGLDTDLLSMTVEVWDQMFAVVARGAMLMCKHAIPLMLEQGKGAIVNISSGKSLAGDMSEGAYGSAKSAVNQLTRAVATMYGKQGVRCNTVSPGVIQTELMRSVVPPNMAERLCENNLTSYLGEPADIANLVAFLVSDRASYITGQLIPVDGGFSAHLPSVAAVKELDVKEQNLQPLKRA